jgi:hypothetical protein
MRKIALVLLFCFAGVSAAAEAQTYFGVLTVPANGGPGGSCCSTVSYVTPSNAAVPSDGSCAGCTIITQAQYAAYQTAAAAVGSGNVQSILITGLAVTFSTTTSANATYAADPITLAGYQNQINNLFVAGTFIGASALLTVKDVTGTGHAMSAAAFKALYSALQTYAGKVTTAQATALANNTAPVYPSTTLSPAIPD